VNRSGEERLTVALPKGRLLEPSIALFEAVGAPGARRLRGSRRLAVEDRAAGLRFLVIRPADIPTYVEYGAAEAGIVGKDVLLEQARDVYEPLDLGFGACRLVVAEPANLRARDDPRDWSALRVATKYPALAERHFAAKGVHAEIICLSGSVELAPLLGLAERIVDLVASGETLRANGLVEVEEIARATARLIVNRASLKTRYARIKALIDALSKAGRRAADPAAPGADRPHAGPEHA
jgi:ATP phosphoribosyltransferase